MATVNLGTVIIPDAAIPPLVAEAEERLAELGIDFSGLTSAQKVRRYLVELLKGVLVQRRHNAAEVAARSTVLAERAAAEAEAAGIS
jgi:hypothetical protein